MDSTTSKLFLYNYYSIKHQYFTCIVEHFLQSIPMEMEEVASESSDNEGSSDSDESLCEQEVEEEGCKEVILVPTSGIEGCREVPPGSGMVSYNYY